MKVISRGTQRITCKQCGSVLEYEWADIKEWNNIYCIICPVCGKALEVEDKISNPYADLHGCSIVGTAKPYTVSYGQPYDIFQRDSVYASASNRTVDEINSAIAALSTSATEGATACSALAEACTCATSKEDDLCTLTAEN